MLHLIITSPCAINTHSRRRVITVLPLSQCRAAVGSPEHGDTIFPRMGSPTDEWQDCTAR